MTLSDRKKGAKYIDGRNNAHHPAANILGGPGTRRSVRTVKRDEGEIMELERCCADADELFVLTLAPVVKPNSFDR